MQRKPIPPLPQVLPVFLALAACVAASAPSRANALAPILVPLDPADPTTGDGMWIGHMAVGDIDGDGTNELLVMTMDNNRLSTNNANEPDDDDARLHALKLARGGSTVTEAAGFPISAVGDMVQNIHWDNNQARYHALLVDDLGDGKGNRLFYVAPTYSHLGTVSASGTVARAATNTGSLNSRNKAIYGNAAYVLVDCNGDGVKDIVQFGRNDNNPVVALDGADRGTPLWHVKVPNNNKPLCAGGAGDLDGDGIPEIFAVGVQDGETHGITALKASDGSRYVSRGGTTVEDLTADLVSKDNVSAISAADVTGDGIPEFIYTDAGSGTLKVVTQEGEALFTASSSGTGGFALFDLDKDNDYEILYGDKLYGGDGTVLDTLPVPAGAAGFVATIAPVVADFTGDQVPEAVYVCTKNVGSAKLERILTVYNFRQHRTLDGFPVELGASTAAETADLWHAGSFNKWGGARPLVADLDGDGFWEIIVGTGVPNPKNGTTSDPATLNIIRTPYSCNQTPGRTPEEAGWYSFKKGPLMDSLYPLAKRLGIVILFQ